MMRRFRAGVTHVPRDTADLEAERARLDQTRRHAEAWKQRCADALRRVADLKGRVAALEQSLARVAHQRERERAEAVGHREAVHRLEVRLAGQAETLARAKRQHERSHRSILSVDVVRGVLPLRTVTARARAALPEAVARGALFRETSTAFVAAADRAAQAPTERILKVSLQGVPFWVPVLRSQDAEPGSRWLAKQRFPYRGIVQTRELAMGGIMLDLGANIGRMSIPRVMLGDVVAAYCAEPDPINYECLVRSTIDNDLAGLVLPDHVAIGDRVGVARLRRSRFPGGHHLVDGDPDDDTIEVPLTTLDAWVRRHGIDLPLVSFIKVDVQGWEGHVLDGAAGVLAHRHIAWQMEVSPAMLRAAGTDPAAHCRRLAGLFTHFTDLNKEARGERGRPTRELVDALAYVGATPDADQTDVLLFNLTT